MNHFLKELKHMVNKFFEDIEAKIGAISAAEDPEKLKAEILTSVKEVTDAQAQRITDLETALTDTINHLTTGNTTAATDTANAALAASSGTDTTASGV